jgi:starvation-inducible DNA-binding protein
MEQLLIQLKQLLADNIALAFKAQGYHWNVESDDFPQLHEFFGKIYENFGGATDGYAEWMRMLKVYAPYRLVDFFDQTTVGEPYIIGEPEPMLADLYTSIEKHIADLVVAGKLANTSSEFGLANFFAERQTASQKLCWQLRASIEIEESDTNE